MSSPSVGVVLLSRRGTAKKEQETRHDTVRKAKFRGVLVVSRKSRGKQKTHKSNESNESDKQTTDHDANHEASVQIL